MSVFWCGFHYATLQVNGQRFIGPPEHVPEPSYRFELFVKNLPRHLFERELVPLFSSAGFVYQIRLLMCFTGLNRGIAYVRYTNEQDFQRAVTIFHELQLTPRFLLYACRSLNLSKLVMLDIDPAIDNFIIREVIREVCGGECVFFGIRNCKEGKKFVIIQFKCHYETALSRRKLIPVCARFGETCYLKWYAKR
ncbi:hypothetical protein pipiens_014157 [Culex pipiens pipiens]|uniref:RRM domain-containing protein n=1 Tax=Culex pipiens pipiens TaxID=38569 RepID=A0ABD1CVP2_CULPP